MEKVAAYGPHAAAEWQEEDEDDIGGAIASLLMGDFGWLTAQRIELSGGQSI